MRFVVVVGVLIWTSLLVSVGSTSIGIFRQNYAEFQDQDFNGTLDMADSPETGLAAKSSNVKYTVHGFRVGCYKKFCYRNKWKDSSRWGWIEAWDYKPGGKKSEYVPCNLGQNYVSNLDDQYCLDYVKQRPGDFPCYASKWSGNKRQSCYKGRRYGCEASSAFIHPKLFRDGWCWCETLTAPYYWHYPIHRHSKQKGKRIRCDVYRARATCSRVCHAEIDKLDEI